MDQMEQNRALLIMDMQTAILQRLADPRTVVNNTARAIAHARKSKIPLIYVIVGFRPGTPEISASNKFFGAMKERLVNMTPEEWMTIEPTLAPEAGEIVVIKRRVSAFAGSDLEVVLRSLRIQHMILTGVSTSGVVLSTTREAADKDYRLTILADCCGDADEEAHRVLTTKIFVRQADVMSVDEWSKI